MTQSDRSRFTISFLLMFLCGSTFAVAQNLLSDTAIANSAVSSRSMNDPGTSLSAELRRLELVGTYRADGAYLTFANTSRVLVPDGTDTALPNQLVVPTFIRLGSNEAVVQNLIPPTRASEPLKGHSLLAMLRDNLITFAYGHAKVLQTPGHLITDSRGRLIVSDPQLPAVHVLDSDRKASFRILGGPSRRLQSPGALAVDSRDNIYVADVKVGLISVYDPSGKFIRYIGDQKGESMFDSPTAIAIDPKTDRLYVLDTTADELVVLDRGGSVVKRAGNERTGSKLSLRHPTEVAVWKNEVVVLDNYGSRIQIMDLECNPIRNFAVREEHGPPILSEVGMALDGQARIYLGNLLSSGVRVYSDEGEFLGFIGGSPGGRRFNLPIGLWIDSSERLFVSDSNNSRVQVFQIPTASAPTPAAR
jgi:hypothetical protein